MSDILKRLLQKTTEGRGARPAAAAPPSVDVLLERITRLRPRLAPLQHEAMVRLQLGRVFAAVKLASDSHGLNMQGRPAYEDGGGAAAVLVADQLRRALQAVETLEAHVAEAEQRAGARLETATAAPARPARTGRVADGLLQALGVMYRADLCRGAEAMDRARRNEVPPRSRQAAVFSLPGVLARAADGDPGLQEQLAQTVAFVLGTQPAGLQAWNDQPGRTKREVLEVLQRAAEAAGVGAARRS